jgi:maltose alpha-D-glucosyltransferase/alpha-amylase
MKGLPEDVRAAAQRLLDAREALAARIDALVPTRIDAAKTRYHGDYHLGQVLINQHDFIIVDFEGEPSRPLEERRAKHSPLRDVAGMLRSFGYAAAVAARQAAPAAADRGRLEAPLTRWQSETTRAFLDAYEAHAAGIASHPADRASAAQLVALFTLEKALYELRYELANRPDWVAIPLGAILQTLEGAQ